jgi:hypothetical protein
MHTASPPTYTKFRQILPSPILEFKGGNPHLLGEGVNNGKSSNAITYIDRLTTQTICSIMKVWTRSNV